MAVVITQAYTCMIQIGVAYGCVCTGEATIFLHVPHDPTIVYYFLSVAKGGVGDTTDWARDSDGPNRLHHRRWADAGVLDDIPSNEASSSEYRPPRDPTFLRPSPVTLRRRPAPPRSPNRAFIRSRLDSSDEEPDVETPSRQPVGPHHLSHTQPTSRSASGRDSRCAGQAGQYCTHTFLKLIRQQLSKDLDNNCEPIGIHGACGVPFRVRLGSHGYTVIAKAIPVWSKGRL